MIRSRGGQKKGGGQRNPSAGFNRKQNGGLVESGAHQWDNSNSSNRAKGFRGNNRGGYANRRGNSSNSNRNFNWNQFGRDNDEEQSQTNFRYHNPDLKYQKSSNIWYDNNGDFSNGTKNVPCGTRKVFSSDLSPHASPLTENQVVNEKASIENEQPKLNIRIKTESSLAQKETEPSGKESLPANDKVKPPEKKQKERSEKTSATDSLPHCSKEKTSVSSVKEAPAASSTTSTSSESDDSESDDTDSSAAGDIPDMPRPVRIKKEQLSQADVVCLGNKSNIQNITDEDSDDPKTCIICNKNDHPTTGCRIECKICKHNEYEMQMVCKNCGETYREGLPSASKPPNFFSMFMQFMQFCAIQNNSGAFTQLSNAPVATLGVTQKVETSRKDSVNSKPIKKKRRNSSRKNKSDDSEADSAPKSNSIRKRKKTNKTTQSNTQPQHHLQSFHANMQFPTNFHTPGFNPMFGFNPMMGFNPATMNFTK